MLRVRVRARARVRVRADPNPNPNPSLPRAAHTAAPEEARRVAVGRRQPRRPEARLAALERGPQLALLAAAAPRLAALLDEARAALATRLRRESLRRAPPPRLGAAPVPHELRRRRLDHERAERVERRRAPRHLHGAMAEVRDEMARDKR